MYLNSTFMTSYVPYNSNSQTCSRMKQEVKSKEVETESDKPDVDVSHPPNLSCVN